MRFWVAASGRHVREIYAASLLKPELENAVALCCAEFVAQSPMGGMFWSHSCTTFQLDCFIVTALCLGLRNVLISLFLFLFHILFAPVRSGSDVSRGQRPRRSLAGLPSFYQFFFCASLFRASTVCWWHVVVNIATFSVSQGG